MEKKFIKVGICGLSCRLCPAYHRETKNKCPGCKSEYRMGAPCPFHTCAIKKKKLAFCGFCIEKDSCEKWSKHREAGRQHDSFVCYQRLEDNIAFIQKNGIEEFEKQQEQKEELLKEFLVEFNEGRSKTLYCIAATLLEIDELESCLRQARAELKGLDIAAKSKVMHSILKKTASSKNYLLVLRK